MKSHSKWMCLAAASQRGSAFGALATALILIAAGCTAIVDKTLVELGPDCEGIENGRSCPGISEEDTRICMHGSCVETLCGDGFVDPRFEECDDDTPGCRDCRYICTTDEDCDDGEFCNGKEVCNSVNLCAAGSLPPVRSSCPMDDGRTGVCNAQQRCDLCGNLSNEGEPCADGMVCRDAECVESVCGDGIVDPRRGETCDVDHPGCIDCVWQGEVDADCDGGATCAGTERCEGHLCLPRVWERGDVCPMGDGREGVCDRSLGGSLECAPSCTEEDDCQGRCGGSASCDCRGGLCYAGCDVLGEGDTCFLAAIGGFGTCNAAGICTSVGSD